MAAPNLPPGIRLHRSRHLRPQVTGAGVRGVRRSAPLWWNEQPADQGGFGDGGYWVVSKHRDVREVSLRSDMFSSAKKSVVPRYKGSGAGTDRGRTNVDDHDGRPRTQSVTQDCLSRIHSPRHRAATGRTRGARRADRRAGGRKGSGDFVRQVARELPLQAIAGLLGVPQEEREKLFDWTNQMIGSEDPEFAEYDSLSLGRRNDVVRHAIGGAQGEEHGDDIVSTLIQADADGQLSDAEFGMFVVTLAIAGNETTRNSITQGMMAFTDYPEQWELFKRAAPEHRRRRDHSLGLADNRLSANRAG